MTVTIPHKLTQGKKLVKEIYEFHPTVFQKKALASARKNRKRGETLTLSELKTRLGFAD